MDEYIRREDAVNALAKTMPTPATPDGAGEFDHEIHIADEAFADAIRIIESLEPADVVPVVHGRWIPQKENHEFKEALMNCSACGYPVSRWTGNTNFCPNCGARMIHREE